MTTETSTLYKLIVLYMLNHADSPLTNATISDLILAKEYTNYFSLQRAICELETSDLVVAESADNSTHYRITEEGKNTLSFFEDKISDAIKKDIIDFYNDHQIALKQDCIPLFTTEEMQEICSLAVQAGIENDPDRSHLLDKIIHKAECMLPQEEQGYVPEQENEYNREDL